MKKQKLIFKNKPLQVIKSEKNSGKDIKSERYIPNIKLKNYRIINKTLIGDAPKDFVYIYKYEKDGKVRRANYKTWDKYIVKSARKWYPVESITEQLLTDLGNTFIDCLNYANIDAKLEMATTQLARINGQIKFLSKYFLKEDEQLIHGAEIFSGYLEDDNFVKIVEENDKEGEIFTVQVVRDALNALFSDNGETLFAQYCWMLIFDCWVGNNDRHFYNWGVIKCNKSHSIRFAPIFDTARGLMWNELDEKLRDYNEDPNMRRIKKYCTKSKPKVSMGSKISNINHFSFIKELLSLDLAISNKNIVDLLKANLCDLSMAIINTKYKTLMSTERKEVLKKILLYRSDLLLQHLK